MSEKAIKHAIEFLDTLVKDWANGNNLMTSATCGNAVYHATQLRNIHVAALERAGETKPYCRKHDNGGVDIETPCTCRPAPTPATVERFNAYKFIQKSQMVGTVMMERHVWIERQPIGEVVATRHGSLPLQCVEVTCGGESEIFSPKQYDWLVKMMLDNKYWERQA